MNFTTEEYRDIEKVFKNDVCRQCGMCKNLKSPEFCTHFFIETKDDFIKYVLGLVRFCRIERKPLYQKLLSFEGFHALFCDDHICKRYSEARCSIDSAADCYQLFKTQLGEPFNEKEAAKLVESWDQDKFEEICAGIELASADINEMPKKKRRRLYKIGRQALAKLQKLERMKLACGYHGYDNVKVFPKKAAGIKPASKPIVATKWFFGNNEFANVVKNILEGTYKQKLNEDNNRQQHNAG